jgi:hypothetical protein
VIDSKEDLLELLKANKGFFDGISRSAYCEYRSLKDSLIERIFIFALENWRGYHDALPGHFVDQIPDDLQQMIMDAPDGYTIDDLGVDLDYFDYNIISNIDLLTIVYIGIQTSSETGNNDYYPGRNSALQKRLTFNIPTREVNRYDNIYKKIEDEEPLSEDDLRNPIKRKLIILFFLARHFFYPSEDDFRRRNGDSDEDFRRTKMISFRDRLGRILENCGMARLYVGNPFDWMVLHSVYHDDPYTYYHKIFHHSYYYD